jgi:cytochrome c biogenesis protein CcmG, thiol:disulfide interchange protein DsbE
LIDKSGVIRYKQIGPVTEDVWRDKFLPLVQKLNREGAAK